MVLLKYASDRGTRKRGDVLLNVREVASMLRVHPNTVRMWSNEGLLPVYRIGPRGDRRFRLRDVETLLRRSQEVRV